jgi:hypothetical protein
MIDKVDQTLKHWRTIPFDWGEENCLLSIANYVKLCTGNDWGARFRKDCLTEDDAHRFFNAEGGAVMLIDASGLEATLSPERGDIMVIDHGPGLPALCTGPGAALRLHTGVAEINLKFVRIVKAWKVPQ